MTMNQHPLLAGWQSMNKYPKIILASGSPRRKALLQQIDLEFKVIPSSIHEDFSVDKKPKEFVEYYSRLKALDVADKYSDHLVIGADTVVVLNDKIIGKPKDTNDSKRILRNLSGNTHIVITGVTLVLKDKKMIDTFSKITKVTFNNLTDEHIQYYIDNYKPFDKAGSYGIQDWFAVCVKKIEGCYFNVMGFPLSKFYKHYTKILKDIK